MTSLQSGGPEINAAPPDPVASDVELRALWRLLVRRRWVIAGAVLASVALGILVTVRAPRIYRARATILIEHSPPEVLAGVREVYDLGSAGYWNSKEYYTTQYQVIRSRPVAERVVGRLGIAGPTLADELEAAGPESLEARVAADPLSGLTERLRDKLKLVGFDGPTSRAAMVKTLRHFDAVSFVQRKIEVVPVSESRLVSVAIEDTDPERAAAIANAAADAYEELNLDQKLGVTRSAVDWLSDQVQDLKGKLEASELALHEFKKENNVVSVSMEDHQTMVSQTLTQLNQSLSTVRAQRLSLESRRDIIRDAEKAGMPPDAIDAVIGNPLIQKLKGDYTSLRQEEAELGLRYTDEHPKLAAVRKKLTLVAAEVKREIDKVLTSLDDEYRAAVETERRLGHTIETVKSEALEINKKELDYSRLKRDRDNNLDLYELVLKRQKETDLTQMLRVNNVRKLEAAMAPVVPVRPVVKTNLLIALILGLLAGVALAFLVDYLDNTIKTQQQVTQRLALPFLGIVPLIRGEKTDPALADDAARDHYIVAHPRSSVAECCRTVRTNLLFMSPDRPARTILVTSAGPREGKSTIAVNLAITTALSGARVLLVDTDMRRPRIHKSFGLSVDTGLSNAIVNETAVDHVIQRSGIEGLDVLPCGPIPPNPAELLHTESFRAIREHLASRYDRVIFDSPPVTAVTDALVLSSMVDGVVLVALAGRTTWQLGVQAKRRVLDVGGRILGVVLNNVDVERGDSGGYYQYYYYRSGYAEEDKSAVA